MRYTREQIIQSLQDFYKKYNTTSSYYYLKSGFKPHMSIIIRKFGRWENALIVAGLIPTSRNKVYKRYSKNEAIQSLLDFYKEHGNISYVSYNKSNRSPCSATIARIFGSWNQAIEKAGLIKKRNYPNKDICQKEFQSQKAIQSLREFYLQNGNRITPKEYSKSKFKPSLSVIINLFGTWKEALIAANLPSVPSGKKGVWKSQYEQKICEVCKCVFQPMKKIQVTCSKKCYDRKKYD